MPKPIAEDDVIDLTAAVPDFTASRKAHADEFLRVSSIQTLAANHPKIAAEAIAGGWSADKTENAVLRADLPKPPAPINPHTAASTGAQADADVLTAALCLSAGMKPAFVAEGVAQSDRERVMNQATAGKMKGFGLHSLLGEVIRTAGGSPHGHGKDGFLKAAYRAERELQATGSGITTISLSGILGTVANKALLNAYTAVNTVWDKIAAIRNHSDFKTYTRYRLDTSGAMKKVGPDGEIKHVGLAEASYTNKVDTYAGMIALTRQMQINDDLGAFTQIPASFGRMAKLRVEEAVFSLILANTGSFFATGNANLLSGATSVLAIDGAAMGLAEALFMNMVDSNGKAVLTSPSVLLVPTALSATANLLNTAASLATGASSTIATQNQYAGKYPPVVSPYLNNTALRDQDGVAFSGQSATAWYLFANPAERAAVAVAFLNGEQQPTIESAETDFNTLGMQWRAYLDFGVGFEDPTAAIKMAGA